jgi:hypothetical protein
MSDDIWTIIVGAVINTCVGIIAKSPTDPHRFLIVVMPGQGAESRKKLVVCGGRYPFKICTTTIWLADLYVVTIVCLTTSIIKDVHTYIVCSGLRIGV